MEIQLIQLYLLVCHIYDTQSETCFQRLSTNSKPLFTDQELVTIYLFDHLNNLFEKKEIHKFIQNYWREFSPICPVIKHLSLRLNLLEQTFQTVIYRVSDEQEISLPTSSLIGDKAFPDPTFQAMLNE